MKTLNTVIERTSRKLAGAWHILLGFTGMALAFAARSGESNGTRWAKSAATAWGLTRHDGASVLDWISLALVIVTVIVFALSLKGLTHRAAAFLS